MAVILVLTADFIYAREFRPPQAGCGSDEQFCSYSVSKCKTELALVYVERWRPRDSLW
jgi:hypothetical protein